MSFDNFSKPPISGVLSHHGVKGQKWGVRRQRKINANAGLQRFSENRDARVGYSSREISEKEYKSLSAKPVPISSPGGIFKRVDGTKNPQLRGSLVYVTSDDAGHNTYVALFPPGGNLHNTKKFSTTIKATEAVISPGYKVRVDTFIKTLDQPVHDLNTGTTHTGRDFLTGGHESPEFKALSNKELGLKYYQTFVQSQHANTPLHEAYLSNIKKQGYNAIRDDADAGLFNNTSVIIFPKEAGLHITEVKPLTEHDILDAQGKLQLPGIEINRA